MAERRRNLYEILGVTRDADTDALRKAYRKLARKFHPDVNPGDKAAEEKFKEVSLAYSVLSDSDKRRAYDEFGDVSLEGGFDAEAARRAREAFGGGFGARTRGAPGAGAPDFEDLEDLLGGFFSRHGRPRGGARRGVDVEAELYLELTDAARGGEQRLTLGRPAADGSARRETVTVRIPPGVTDGGRIRIPGKGGEGAGGAPPGDLWATVRIRPHALFRLEGRDLHLELPVSVREAVLGAKVEIPTLDGRASVTIPPGTDSGRLLRLRGKGLPDPGGGPPGDLLARVRIRVPRGLDAEAVRKLEDLARFDPPDLREELQR